MCVDGEVGNVATWAKCHGQVNPDTYVSYDYYKTRGGWKSNNYLIDIRLISNIPSFFALFDERPHNSVFSPPEEVIKTVTSTAGLCILDNSSAYVDGDLLPEASTDRFIEFGIGRFECFTPYRRDETSQAYCGDFCRTRDVRVSIGSDYHGAFRPEQNLADPPITLDMTDKDDLLP